MSTNRARSALSIRELVLLALIGALMFGSKVAMSALPNIHLNAVLILLAVMLFGKRAFYSVFVYVMLEGLIYGFGLWFISYLYAWPLLVLLALPFRNNRSYLIWAMLAGVHGLFFGALCSIPYIFMLGFPGAVAWWVSGLPYDVIHCVSNFVLTFVLLKPLYQSLSKLMEKKHG